MSSPKLDRLARTLSTQETVLQTVWRADGSVFAADQGEVLQDDPDDPMRTFVRQVIGGVAQLERSLIAKRMRDGRRIKAEQGGFAFGAPPFGYRAEGRELVVEPDEAATLSRILELDRSGASLCHIGSVLEAEGRTTKRGGTRVAPHSARRHPSSSSSCGVMARLTYSVAEAAEVLGVSKSTAYGAIRRGELPQ